MVSLRHRVEAALAMPPWTRRDRLRQAARLAMCRDTLGAVADLVPGPVILLKGEPLARELYDDRLQRATTDVDVLIRAAEVAPTVEHLRQLGFRPLHPRIRPWAYNQYALAPPRGHAIVELHWRLSLPLLPAPPFEGLMARSRIEKCGRARIHTLGPADLLIHLALHFQQHGGFRKGLVDVAAWLDRYDEEEPIVAEAIVNARQLGLLRLVAWPVFLVESKAGSRTGTGSLLRAEPGLEDAPLLIDQGRARIEDPRLGDLGKAGEFIWQMATAADLVDRRSDRLRAVLGAVFCGPHRLGNHLGPRVGPRILGTSTCLESPPTSVNA